MSACIKGEQRVEILATVEELVNSGKFRSFKDYMNHALELLNRIDASDNEFNMMVVLLMTSQVCVVNGVLVRFAPFLHIAYSKPLRQYL